MINNHLSRGRGGKVSLTHVIGFAVVRAMATMPEMGYGFTQVDGKPAVLRNEDMNLGLAIDLAKDDGTRQLLVPNIKGAQRMDFAAFWAAYEDVVRRARSGKLEVTDFAGTTVSLTNPGTIGTNHSIPRLMEGQGCIVGVGAMEYPADWQGASTEDDRPERRVEDHDSHEHLRPPASSRVRNPVSSCAAFINFFSAKRTSTARSSVPCASPTSLFAGPTTSQPVTRRTWTRRSGCKRSSTPTVSEDT